MSGYTIPYVTTRTNQVISVTLKKKPVKRKSFFQRLFGR